MKEKEEKQNTLILIPKVEQYMEYILNMLIKIPRTEKYSIGTEYKSSMYEMMQNILYLNKIEANKRIYYLNKIDALLSCQRIYLRVYRIICVNSKRYTIFSIFSIIILLLHFEQVHHTYY